MIVQSDAILHLCITVFQNYIFTIASHANAAWTNLVTFSLKLRNTKSGYLRITFIIEIW